MSSFLSLMQIFRYHKENRLWSTNCAIENAKAKLFPPSFPTKHQSFSYVYKNYDTIKHWLANIKCLTDIFYAIDTDFIVIQILNCIPPK